jgi:hypothetical protein
MELEVEAFHGLASAAHPQLQTGRQHLQDGATAGRIDRVGSVVFGHPGSGGMGFS